MTRPTKDTLSKSAKMTVGEAKSDAINRAAWSIIDQQKAATDAKTARLRLARLAREAAADKEGEATAPTARAAVRKQASGR